MKLLFNCHFSGQTNLCFTWMRNKWNSPVVGCPWFVALWLNANLFVLRKKILLDEPESLTNRLCGMKWGCVASLELLRHLQAKISSQSDWSHMWRRNNVLEAVNAEQLGNQKKKYIVDVLTGASEAESTTEDSLCFVRWRRVAQTSSASLFLVFMTMTVPKFPLSKKFCWKDQHLLRSHVQIIMCGSWKKKKLLQGKGKLDRTCVGTFSLTW